MMRWEPEWKWNEWIWKKKDFWQCTQFESWNGKVNSVQYSFYDLRTENRCVSSCRANQTVEDWRVSCGSCPGSEGTRTCDRYKKMLAVRKIRWLQKNRKWMSTIQAQAAGPPRIWKEKCLLLCCRCLRRKNVRFRCEKSEKNLNRVRIPEKQLHRHK